MASGAGAARGAGRRPITRVWEDGHAVYRVGGRRVSNAREIARIEALAIPPAWRDVEIARSPRAKVLARGVDAAGRSQAIYHPAFRKRREREKFERILRFAERLPALRRQVDRDLRRPGLRRDRVVACVIRLMDEQFFRVGNERYAREHGSFGVTTLQRRHVEVSSSSVVFDFVGKSGKRHRRTVRDRRIARLVAQLEAAPGHELFRFMDEDGEMHDLRSSQVNAYVKRHMGEEFSAKDFRTWGGTLLAVSALLSAELGEEDVPASKAELASTMRRVVREVAERLGNTPAVTRSSYIDPRVFAAVEDGATLPRVRRAMTRMRPRRYLSVEEQCVLRVLGRARS